MSLTIERFVTGPIDTNTYVIADKETLNCLVCDPSSGCQDVLRHIDEKKYAVKGICLTHGHFDHILGIGEIRASFPDIQVFAHADEKLLLANSEYNGSVLMGMNYVFNESYSNLIEGPVNLFGISFELLHVPGHSPGGIAFVFDTICLCGDSIFAGSIGRTDFPLCDGPLLIKGLREKILPLPDEMVLCPGHGGRTTVGREKKQNPFLQ
jgi:glyoxylase-like metal-dependent hydrolase (beta-lactamase superfamily II)